MSSVNSKIVRCCTSILLVILTTNAWAWEVDFTRRQVQFDSVKNDNRLPASESRDDSDSLVTRIFEPAEPTQDVVILNTETGFIPQTLHLKKGNSYRLHIVNVNNKEKNVSFVVDAFAEHHNTIFGEEKTFSITPKAEGIYTYQCPETAAQGKLVIFSDGERKPASAKSE